MSAAAVRAPIDLWLVATDADLHAISKRRLRRFVTMAA